MNASSDNHTDMSLLVANVYDIYEHKTDVPELATTCLRLIHHNGYEKDLFDFLVNRKSAIFVLDLIFDDPTGNRIHA